MLYFCSCIHDQDA